MTDKRKSLIDRLNTELYVMSQVAIHKKYNLESPEVQKTICANLRFNIGEVRLLRDVLTTYHNQHNENVD